MAHWKKVKLVLSQKGLRRAGITVALAIAAMGCATAQQLPNYSKPLGFALNPLAPFTPQNVPPPVVSNTPRIDQLMKDGKLMLSLDDAIALALENNLDLAIARYNLSIADTDILRTKAGASVRGVATGLVQGTPAGGVGGFGTGAQGAGAGGTSGGAGGAGTGASGLVQSTLGVGAPVPSFDPVLTSNLSIEHAAFPLSNTVTTGVNSLQQNTGTANFFYQQAFATGTSFTVGFDNARQFSNSLFTSLVPQVNSNFRFSLQQSLLSGFGIGPNMRFIRIARNNREISDVAFREQVIATVSQIQNIYWDLVSAYEDEKVKERSLSLAEKTLSDNRAQVKLGALPPIEIMRAESEVATRNQDLIVSQSNLQLQQLLMMNAVSRSLDDQTLASAQVIPSDTMDVPEQEPVVPTQDLVNDALQSRPELAQARIDLVNREITKKAARNALLPQLDLVAWYGGSGLGGLQNASATCGNPGAPSPGSCIEPGTIPRSGFYNAFASLVHNDFPDYAVGFNLTIPLRNRAARADQIRSELERRQAQMRLQQLENQIRIEVRNAQYTLQQNRARVEAAKKQRDLAQQNFEIEQKKHTLGASTSFEVLQTQRDLAVAESNLVTAMASYEKSRVELDRSTGLTLNHSGISLQDAETGNVKSLPRVPGVRPVKDVTTGPGQGGIH
jgi:outer membrane protein TolC